MSFDPTEEGDALTAASINDRLAEVAAELNAVKPQHHSRRRLGSKHTPDLLDPYALFTQFTGGSDDALVAAETYDNTMPILNGGVHNMLELFAPSGPYGPYTGLPGTAEDGWLIPRSAGASEGMNVVLNMATDLVTHNLLGLKVSAWVNIQDLWTFANGTDPTANGTPPGDGAAYLGIGIRDSAGTRHVIERSIRRLSTAAGFFSPLSTTTVVDEDDLSQGTLNGDVVEVFGAVLSGIWDADANQHGSMQIQLAEFSIVVEPLRGDELT